MRLCLSVLMMSLVCGARGFAESELSRCLRETSDVGRRIDQRARTSAVTGDRMEGLLRAELAARMPQHNATLDRLPPLTAEWIDNAYPVYNYRSIPAKGGSNKTESAKQALPKTQKNAGDVEGAGEKSGRRADPPHRAWSYYRGGTFPNDDVIKLRVLDWSRQLLYRVQEKLQPLKPILAVYKESVTFRMAFAFSKMDSLIPEMINYYSWSTHHWRMEWYSGVHTTFHCILHYRHILSLYWDVIYTAERIIHINADTNRILSGAVNNFINNPPVVDNRQPVINVIP